MKLEFLAAGSADCPLIRLYDFDRTEVARLFAALSALASRNVESLALHDLPGVEAVADCRLFLRAGAKDKGAVCLPGLARFDCVLTAESWDNVAGLVEPFLDKISGYQWLVTSGDVAWLISADGRW